MFSQNLKRLFGYPYFLTNLIGQYNARKFFTIFSQRFLQAHNAEDKQSLFFRQLENLSPESDRSFLPDNSF